MLYTSLTRPRPGDVGNAGEAQTSGYVEINIHSVHYYSAIYIYKEGKILGIWVGGEVSDEGREGPVVFRPNEVVDKYK